MIPGLRLRASTVAVVTVLVCFAALLLSSCKRLGGPSENQVLVFAAASLKEAAEEIAEEFKRETGTQVVFSFAATSTLAKQIENGAPVDIYISADREWMSYLAARHKIRTETRRNLLTNRLVLIAPANSTTQVDIAAGFALGKLLGDGKIAMADTSAVPAGKYGKAALEKLGVWQVVSGRIAQAENTRAALALVARGEARLGIVYATDAMAEPKVKVMGFFPEDSHPPIVYPMALVEGSLRTAAPRFADFLSSPKARGVWEKHGFIVLN